MTPAETRDEELMSHGIGAGAAKVLVKPETPEEKLKRILKEATDR